MTIRTLIILLAATLPLGACVTEGSQRPFGQAYTEQYNQQIVNEPYAAPTPVEGLDGRLAERAIKRHSDPEADQGPSFVEVLESMMDK